MGGVTAAIIGGSLLGAGASAIAGSKAASASKSAANKAADASLQATRESNALQEQQFNLAMALTEPQRYVGGQANNQLAKIFGLDPSPMYDTPAVGQPYWDGSKWVVPQSVTPGSGPGQPDAPPPPVQTPQSIAEMLAAKPALGTNDAIRLLQSGVPLDQIVAQYRINPENAKRAIGKFQAAGLTAAQATELARTGTIATMGQPASTQPVNGGTTFANGSMTGGPLATPGDQVLSPRDGEVQQQIGKTQVYDAAGNPVGGSGNPTQPTVPGTNNTNPAVTSTPSAPTGSDRYGGFEAFPGYQFRLDEGQRAIEGSAAARGGVMSGKNLKDLTEFAQGTASSEFGRYLEGLRSLAGQQLTGSSAGADAAMSTGRTQGANIVSAGNARASAYQQGGAASAAQYQNLGNIGAGLAQDWLTYQLAKPAAVAPQAAYSI